MSRSKLVIDALTGSVSKVTNMVPTDPKVRYMQLRIDNRVHYIHRLVWESVHGEIPVDKDIDHIDGNTHNNSILNLRLLSHDSNCQNKHGPNITSKSGVKGVNYDEKRNRWRAAITAKGKRIYLGLFKTIDEAKKAYADAAAVHHTHNPSATK